MLRVTGLLLLVLLGTLTGNSDALRAQNNGKLSRSVACRSLATEKPLTKDVTPESLRSLKLFDQFGVKRELGSLMGKEKSVVVFLRHLG